jgi:hypothetical protein
MALAHSDRGRQILLALAALVFAGIAVAALVAPDAMAARLGYRLDNVDARSEYRAIYVGLWLAHTLVLVAAARRVSDALIGDLGAALILGQVAGRVLSIALDGALPTAHLLPIFALETVGGLAILFVRPARR